MPYSERIELPSPLAVVGNDAGAANLIIGWLRDRQDVEIKASLAGPAIAIWSAAFSTSENLSLEDCLEGAALLLSGTSGASDHEHHARRLAKARGIRSVGVLDHWVNYRERFLRDQEIILPDELWVTDEWAQAEAERCFPGHPLKRLPNEYLEGLLQEVRRQEKPRSEGEAVRVLYVLEPMRQSWGRDPRHGEFQALDYFMSRLEVVGLSTNMELRLRPHPSEPKGKYDSWIASNRDFRVTLASESSLGQAIGWAEWVVGCESYALFVAHRAGRRVISSLPPWGPPCRLPSNTIRQLREVK